jgi:hypothetical protein
MRARWLCPVSVRCELDSLAGWRARPSVCHINRTMAGRMANPSEARWFQSAGRGVVTSSGR